MVKFIFKYKKKKFNIDVCECRTVFQKMSGLMFRKKSPALLFIFNKKNNSAIHSFFCVEFITIWFNKGKIIDIKLVKPWKISIKPIGKFDKFLEIPSNKKDFNDIRLLIKK